MMVALADFAKAMKILLSLLNSTYSATAFITNATTIGPTINADE